MNEAISVTHLSKRFKLPPSSAVDPRSLRYAVPNTIRRFLRMGGPPPPQQEFWALRDISFSIPMGAKVGLIGHNGAGKSTLLKVLSRITVPTTGDVRIRGRVCSLLEVGTGFHPELTGRDNIFFSGAILGMKKNEILTKFDEIVDFAEIDRFVDTPMRHYSSGMITKLGFAVGALLNPDILILDEVLSVGDHHFRHKCLKKVEALNRGGSTLLFVTHNLGMMSRLCDRALLLEKGCLVTFDSCQKVLAQYLNHASGHHAEWHGTSEDEHHTLTYGALCLPNSGQPSRIFTRGDTIEVQIAYEVRQQSASHLLSVRIDSVHGHPLAESILSPKNEHYVQGFSVGKHKISLSFDSSQFQDGEYLITVEFRSMRTGERGAKLQLGYCLSDPYPSEYALSGPSCLILSNHWRIGSI